MKPCKKKKREQKSQATSVPAVGLVFIYSSGAGEGKNKTLEGFVGRKEFVPFRKSSR